MGPDGAGHWMMIVPVLIWLVIGGIAGWLAGLVVRGGGFGLVGNVALGIVGALVAGWLLPHLAMGPIGGLLGTIIAAAVGAALVLLVVGLVRRA